MPLTDFPSPSSSPDFDTDVIIVGSGPTGGTAALALATYGVRVHIVSRWNWLANTPRAHITNQRTVEVFRDLGIEEETHRHATPWEWMGENPVVTSLAGEELLRMPAWGAGEERRGDYLRGSPCPLMDLPQTLVEPILFKNAAERGATSSMNTEYLSHAEDSQGVTVHLQDRLSGRRYTLRAKYLIGADGANSQIAKDIGLPITGEMGRAGTLYTLFNADLSSYVQHRPSIMNWIVSPQASYGELGVGMMRAIKPWTQWIVGWGFDMAKGEPDRSDDAVLPRIRALIGIPDIDIEIVHKSIWYVNEAYATEYAKGRVFCAGDAVHRHPPSSGLGLNTCVQDAHNLAWKLAFVLKGHADPSLLGSYSAERAPVGKQIVLRANQSRRDYAALKKVFHVEGADNPVAAGIARFREASAAGAQARLDALEALDIKNREFNAQGVETNQRYTSSAVLPDPGVPDEVWKRDPELYLQPSTRPGAKMPHAWLIDAHGKRISTLDLVGKGKFTLVTGLAGHAWAGAAERLALPFLHVAVIGQKAQQDVYCTWARLREIDEAGVLLVRPDGFIAWRHETGVDSPDAALRLLAGALAALRLHA
ncbi:FAD-dependent oxidoreductase [Massilia sp. LXY-6]|uniref:FAD-dependent oxidoreductase n=1 Tax=Massilia sp. LXY-6 TaxID=3379823 RepID=UPI003EE18460